MRNKNSIDNLLESFVISTVVTAINFITQRVFVVALRVGYLCIHCLFVNMITVFGIIEVNYRSKNEFHLYIKPANIKYNYGE